MELAPLKALIQEVLNTLPKPYSVDVIDETFHSIETKPEWRKRYEVLCDAGTRTTVNTWGARIVGELLGKRGQRSVNARRSSLISTYSLLDTDARTLARKPKAEEAAQMRWTYWKENKDSYPEDVRKALHGCTALIDDLIMDGCTAAEAFKAVTSNIQSNTGGQAGGTPNEAPHRKHPRGP